MRYSMISYCGIRIILLAFLLPSLGLAKINCLRQPVPVHKKEGTLHGEMKDEAETKWGSAHAILGFSIEHVYKWLLIHENWKNMKITELKTRKLIRPGYNEYHRVEIELNPFPLISAEWTEEWGYIIHPTKVPATKRRTVDYTKSKGSKFIRHLCGFIEMKELNPRKTAVTIYEECDCSYMAADKIAKSLYAHFTEMRGLTPKKRERIRKKKGP